MAGKRNSVVLLAIAFFFINGTLALSQKALKVGDVMANPGEKKSGFLQLRRGEP